MCKDKKAFLKQYGLQENVLLSIEDISALTGIPSNALYIVYNRGNNEPKKIRKAISRVYNFVMKGKTFIGDDNDIVMNYGLVNN